MRNDYPLVASHLIDFAKLYGSCCGHVASALPGKYPRRRRTRANPLAKTIPPKAPRKTSGRSRVTNGKIGDMDGRGKWARRFADLIQLYSLDVTDDPTSLPQTTKSLIQRAATMTVELERSEAIFAKDNKADAGTLAEYQTTTNSLRRILQDLQVSAGISGHLERHRPGEPVTYSLGQRFRRLRSFGEDGADSRLSNVELARTIAFMISKATRFGTPLPDEIATLAVENGLAAYADDQTQVIDHAPADAPAISSANDNGPAPSPGPAGTPDH